MSKTDHPLRPKSPLLDATAKRDFLDAITCGASRAEASRTGGFSLSTFYRARRKDAEFRAACDAALPVLPPPPAPVTIAPTNRRRIQLRRNPNLKFDDACKEQFLAHFAGTCNVVDSARAAGVHPATVFHHRSCDAGFHAGFENALEQGYARLEAEALRQRLEAQSRFSEGVVAEGEVAAEFDRVIKLLDRWERRNGRLERHTTRHGRQRAVSFDQAIEALADRLRALDIPIKYLPAPEGEE